MAEIERGMRKRKDGNKHEIYVEMYKKWIFSIIWSFECNFDVKMSVSITSKVNVLSEGLLVNQLLCNVK
jgi:hypothetical protein